MCEIIMQWSLDTTHRTGSAEAYGNVWADGRYLRTKHIYQNVKKKNTFNSSAVDDRLFWKVFDQN